jgi:hypothetical protein
MSETVTDWREINCLIEALEVLIADYQRRLAIATLDDDQRADLSNDLAYAQVLVATYRERRESLRQ